jgi:hypothetical protein
MLLRPTGSSSSSNVGNICVEVVVFSGAHYSNGASSFSE